MTAATAAVSARSTRGPRVTGSDEGERAEAGRLLGGEAALGADEDRPGAGGGGGERGGGGGGGARFVAEEQAPGGVPGVEEGVEADGAGDVEDEGLAALLGGLDGVGAQALGLDAARSLEWRVKTGSTRAAPSSAAFSTMKSVRAFLIGAKTSQRSGGRRCGRPGARQVTAPPSRPVRVTGAEPLAVAAVEDGDLACRGRRA